MRPAMEVAPTRQDGDALADPGVPLQDDGVSPASLLPDSLLEVGVAGCSSEAICVGAEAGDANGVESFGGGGGGRGRGRGAGSLGGG